MRQLGHLLLIYLRSWISFHSIGIRRRDRKVKRLTCIGILSELSEKEATIPPKSYRIYFSNPWVKAYGNRFYSFFNLPYLDGVRWNTLGFVKRIQSESTT
jgi:hypothetical protein